jgi:anti-anti-sigma factor
MDDKPEHYIKSSTEQGVVVITVTEPRLQSDDVAEALRQEMLAAVTRSGLRKVVVNFQHVKYVSSSAFRPLLSLRRKLHEEGGQVVLCGLTSAVGDIFYTTRMVDPNGSPRVLFDMETDVPAAVARLNRPPTE